VRDGSADRAAPDRTNPDPRMRQPLPSTPPFARAVRAGPLALIAAATLAACAGGGAPETAPTPTAGAGGAAAAQPAPVWPLRTREHVDLWLHGFAMLMQDTAPVPIFRRGYRAEIQAARTRATVTTQLDAERDRLQARLAANPRLALSAQFAVLAFASWEEMRTGLQALVQSGGDPQRAGDQRSAAMVAYLAQSFPTGADRVWARLFTNALDDESNKFYHRYWLDAQRDRSPALAAADSVWQRVARPALQRFLNNTKQRDGELLLSIPLGGEGRTVSSGTRTGNLAAVPFPAARADAAEPSYVAAHELVGSVVGSAVADNITPTEQRSGVGDRYTSAAQVRGGYVLLQKVAPTLAAGYARYYLRQAGRADSGEPGAALAAAFPLPQAIMDAVTRQIDVTLGGI
jgi:hypothetical protein